MPIPQITSTTSATPSNDGPSPFDDSDSDDSTSSEARAFRCNFCRRDVSFRSLAPRASDDEAVTLTCTACIDAKRRCDRRFSASHGGRSAAKKKRRRPAYAAGQRAYNLTRRRRLRRDALEAAAVDASAAPSARLDALLRLRAHQRRLGEPLAPLEVVRALASSREWPEPLRRRLQIDAAEQALAARPSPQPADDPIPSSSDDEFIERRSL